MQVVKSFFVIIVFFFASKEAMALNQSLYPNEKLLTVNGFQSLVYFKKGDKNKPLIIFVPGNAHLARIGYGYSESEPKDFLAYWLAKDIHF